MGEVSKAKRRHHNNSARRQKCGDKLWLQVRHMARRLRQREARQKKKEGKRMESNENEEYSVVLTHEEANRVNRALMLLRRLTNPDARMAEKEVQEVVVEKLRAEGYRYRPFPDMGTGKSPRLGKGNEEGTGGSG